MCGIVGYISNNDKLHSDAKDHFMRYALALDTLRGEDSTGLITLNKRFTVRTMKTLMPGDKFVHSNEYLKKYRPGWAQIGHNRAATRGSVVVDNAHPFIFGPITLVHNGTLQQDGQSLPTYDHKLPVDSMQLAHALSQCEPKEAQDMLSKVHGSFALVWSDSRDESVNMARNSERPMHFTYNSARDVLWFMSDGLHLHSINKSFGNNTCRGTAIYEMDRFKIMKFHKGKMQPEVLPFAPFTKPAPAVQKGKVYAGTTKATSTGGSALEKAAKRWEAQLKKRVEKATGGGTQPETDGCTPSSHKVKIAGKLRKVPLPMQDYLWQEMRLGVEDFLQFTPEDAVELRDGTYLVKGTMLHKEWGDTPWPMTVYNVAKVQYNAYKDYDWVVNPVGMCPGHEYDQKHAAVMGVLVHCDWKNHEKNTRESDESETEGDTWVQGPDGLMPAWRLESLLHGGCVNCGADIDEDDVEECLEVNDNQNLICPDCVTEFFKNEQARH